MATGTDIAAGLPMQGGQRTPANDLLAINYAIRTLWPRVKKEIHAASVFTFSAATLSYALSTLTDTSREIGVARLLVYPDSSDAPVEVPSWYQKLNHTTGVWTIQVPAAVASAYAGKSVDVLYWAQHSELSALSDTTALPADLLQAGMMVYYAQTALTQGNVQNSNWRDLLPWYRQEFETAQKRHATYAMTGSGRKAVLP